MLAKVSNRNTFWRICVLLEEYDPIAENTGVTKLRNFHGLNRGFPNRLKYLWLTLCLLSLFHQAAKPLFAAEQPLTVPASFKGLRALVIGDVCNVRIGPGVSYGRITQVSEGQWLDVLDTRDGWQLVKTTAGEGYIAGWLVDIDLESGNIDAKITKTDVNVREGPGSDYRVRFMTQQGSVYKALAKRGEWVKVALGDGTGWIHETLLQLEYRLQDLVETGLLVYPSAASLNITQTAMQGSVTVARLDRGESARFVTCQGAYIGVETVQGIRGWVYGPSAAVISTNDKDLSFEIRDSWWSIGKYSTTTVTHTDVNFRSGPGTSYPVIGTLQKGDVLRVIESSGDWVRALSPKGITGWVAEWLTGSVNKPKSPGFSVTLDATGSTRRVTVTGDFQPAAVMYRASENSLVVSTSALFETEAFLPINAYEFAGVQVETGDITINLLDKANYEILSNEAGKIVIEFAPVITSIDLESRGGIDVLTINTVGYAWPTVARNGDSLVDFFVPGASFVGTPVSSRGELVRCVGVISRNGGTSVLLDSENVPYLLRKSDGVIEARFPHEGLSGKVIVLDPGHEAEDPGALGPTGLSERNANWEIANAAAGKLREAGATVYLTRQGLYALSVFPPNFVPGSHDYTGSLAKRAAWSGQGDIFISLHNDWNRDQNVCGTTCYVCDRNPNAGESRRLANLIQKHLTASLGTQDKGVRDSDLFVTREAKSPAVLVEVMFISNPAEESRLRRPETWENAATGILSAVQEYFQSEAQGPSRSPSGI